MAYAGQSIAHPTLGITMNFIKSHHETNGIGWEVHYQVDSYKGQEFTPHTHLHSDEWFQVLEGSGKYWLNGKEKNCSPGDEIYFPAGKAHIHPWNTGAAPLIMRNIFLINNAELAAKNEIKQMEDYYEHWFHLACRGKVKENGAPYPLQSAVLLNAMRKHLRTAKLLPFLHDLYLTPLAVIGRLKGYKTTVYE